MRSPTPQVSRSRVFLVGALAVSTFLFTAPQAEAASITGKWRGGGIVKLKDGGKERIKCSVTYGRVAGQKFSVTARCASGAGRVDQVGVLTRVNNNLYVGTVENQQYSVRAKVTVNVKNGKQRVSISSSQGSANLQLARR